MRRAIVLAMILTACATARVDVREVHAARFRAMVQNDLDTLAPLLADDLIYVHSTAAVESKQKFLDGLRSGAMKYRSIDAPAPQVRIYGDAAVVTGRSNMAVTMGGADRDIQILYTAVYRRIAGGWQLVTWQSTRVP